LRVPQVPLLRPGNVVVILSDPDPELVEGEGESKDLHFVLDCGYPRSRFWELGYHDLRSSVH
jgi:hypothetical protein